MQYQFVILWLNIIVLIVIYVLMRGQTQKLRLLCATTLTAYILAAILPYMLLSIPFKWVVLFYGTAIMAALLILDKMLYRQQLVMEAASAQEVKDVPEVMPVADPIGNTVGDAIRELEERSATALPAEAHVLDISLADPEPEGSETVLRPAAHQHAGQSTADHGIPAVAGDNLPEAEQPQPDDAGIPADEKVDFSRAAAEETMETADVPAAEFAVPEEAGAYEFDQTVSAASLSVCLQNDPAAEPTAEPETFGTDIEQLIILAFDAKGRDNLDRALDIFEHILHLNPPAEVAQLIEADMEIMAAKLHTAGT